MIELFIALLLALQSNTLCQQGTSVGNWTRWLDDHPNAVRVGEVRFEDEFEFWLVRGDEENERLVLFVFDMDNMPHGQCARQLDVWQMHY